MSSNKGTLRFDLRSARAHVRALVETGAFAQVPDAVAAFHASRAAAHEARHGQRLLSLGASAMLTLAAQAGPRRDRPERWLSATWDETEVQPRGPRGRFAPKG